MKFEDSSECKPKPTVSRFKKASAEMLRLFCKRNRRTECRNFTISGLVTARAVLGRLQAANMALKFRLWRVRRWLCVPSSSRLRHGRLRRCVVWRFAGACSSPEGELDFRVSEIPTTSTGVRADCPILAMLRNIADNRTPPFQARRELFLRSEAPSVQRSGNCCIVPSIAGKSANSPTPTLASR